MNISHFYVFMAGLIGGGLLARLVEVPVKGLAAGVVLLAAVLTAT